MSFVMSRFSLTTVFILLGIVWLSCWSSVISAEEPGILFVQVRATKLRSQPLHWANPVADLQYGQALKVISEERAWYLVRAESLEGYIHQSAVTNQRVVLQTGADNMLVNPTDTDIVLAGKGFSKEIEDLYVNQNPELDLTAVNRLERLRVDSAGLLRFIRQGELSQGELQ